MIAGLFLYAARDLAGLYRHLGRPADAERIERVRGDDARRGRGGGWDGEWFLRAFDAQGRPVGSHVCDEGQIFIESQGWCVLGGAGSDNGRARRALETSASGSRRLTASSSISPRTALPRRARRDHELSAGLQGERRHLLPYEPVDHARLVPAW